MTAGNPEGREGARMRENSLPSSRQDGCEEEPLDGG